MDTRQPGWGVSRHLWLLLLLVACAGVGGCSTFWDDVTARDFKFKAYFFEKPPDPLVVLRDSTDGNQRAKALAALKEPRQTGGSEQEQDVVVKILTTAATQDRQPWCRRAAIATLSSFKDPRVVEALRDAYYAADRGGFQPEISGVLRCQTLEALGSVGDPAAVDFLVLVLREPRVEGAEHDKQQKTDERIAAVRALGHFKQYQATEALVDVLKSDQDVALRECARASLVAATGKDLPADARAWEDLLHQPEGTAVVGEPKKLLGIIPVSW